MESFYGGQQGFSFVVKRNSTRDDGYFNNLNDINTAIDRGDLRYGDYAIVTGLTGTGNSYNSGHGDLYRINAKNQPERVANISHPALSTLIKGLSSFNNNVDVSQTASINFLDSNSSTQQSTLDLSWEYEEDNGVITGIRIGVKAPRPVVDIAVQQKQIDASNPLAIASNQGIIHENDNSDDHPFYYNYQIQLPMRSILVSKDINIDTTDLDTGTLCFITSEEKGKWYDTSFFGANGTVSMMSADDLSGQGAGSYYMDHWDYSGILFKKAIYVTNYSIARILPPKDSNQQWYFCYKILSEELNSSNINMTGMSNISSVGEDFSLASENESSDKYLYLWIGIQGLAGTIFNNPKETFKNFQLKVSK